MKRTGKCHRPGGSLAFKNPLGPKKHQVVGAATRFLLASDYAGTEPLDGHAARFEPPTGAHHTGHEYVHVDAVLIESALGAYSFQLSLAVGAFPLGPSAAERPLSTACESHSMSNVQLGYSA